MVDKNEGRTYSRYTDEERRQALSVSLTGLASYLGYTVVHAGYNHSSLKEMDSLIMYDDKTWVRWSKKGHINGGTTIDFMMEFGGCNSVPEAIHRILDICNKDYEIGLSAGKYNNVTAEKESKKNFVLPPKNDNQRRLFAYLMQTRGLSQEVVSDFVHRKLIYEEASHHNIVFCGYDPDGVVRYAGMRGTADIYGRKFKCDVAGNDKNYGVNIVNKESDELRVFESVIDLMSYIDITGDKSSFTSGTLII